MQSFTFCPDQGFVCKNLVLYYKMNDNYMKVVHLEECENFHTQNFTDAQSLTCNELCKIHVRSIMVHTQHYSSSMQLT